MTAWRHLDGMTDAPAVQQRMKEAREYVKSTLKANGTIDKQMIPAVSAAAHATAIRPDNADASRAALDALDTRQAERQTWWAAIHHDAHSPYAPATALLTEHAAREESNQADAKAEAERQAAEQRRLAAQKAAEKAQVERERERAATERAGRRLSTTRKWKRWTIPLLLCGALSCWLGVGLLVFVHGDNKRSLVSLLDWPFGWAWIDEIYRWWMEGPGEFARDLDWLFGLEPEGSLALQLGIAMAATGGLELVLGLSALTGHGVTDGGALSTPVRLLRAGCLIATAAGALLFLPWALAGVVALLTIIGTIVAAIVGIILVIYAVGIALAG
jgi:hypothetical protein